MSTLHLTEKVSNTVRNWKQANTLIHQRQSHHTNMKKLAQHFPERNNDQRWQYKILSLDQVFTHVFSQQREQSFKQSFVFRVYCETFIHVQGLGFDQ